MDEPFSLLSVCTNLPTTDRPERGLFVQRRLENLSAHCKVQALCPIPYFPWLKPFDSSEKAIEANVPVSTRKMFYLPGIAKRLDGRWMQRCVESWLKEIRPPANAVLDAHFGYPEGVGCVFAAETFRLPVFITIRGLEVDLLSNSTMRPVLVDALQRATGVIAVSDFLRNEAVRAGVDEKRIAVVGNGVDHKLYSRGCSKEARALLGIEQSQKMAVCVGTIKRVKGHDVLIDAWSDLVHKHGTSAKLICIGGKTDSQWHADLQRRARDKGVAQHIEFLGARSPKEIVSWLRAADLFTLASHREGCCNAVLEALATGTPVVATRVGDNANVVTSPAIGRLVPPGNAASFADALAKTFTVQHDPMIIAESVANRTWEKTANEVFQYLKQKLDARR